MALVTYQRVMPSRTVDRKCDYLMMRRYAVEVWNTQEEGNRNVLSNKQGTTSGFHRVVAKSLPLYEWYKCTSST